MISSPPVVFPDAWMSAWGAHRGRPWCAMTVNGVRQVMVWIEPGSFLMGSPEDEPERLDRETQHSVTILKGFWMGATTCSQAFWQAVMGENPSHFQDPQKPVEQVSWDDVQGFLKKLNDLFPTLGARLPSEVEWEYACRAGTNTAFSFGDYLTPELANYDGNLPYHQGEKGLYRQETLSVDDLSPNSWGLYQMHGNVYEWCQNRYEPYQSNQEIDQTDSYSGERRVMRGGSWIDRGTVLRSACRLGVSPVERNDFIGFRFVNG